MRFCSITYTQRDHDNRNSCLIEGVPTRLYDSWAGVDGDGELEEATVTAAALVEQDQLNRLL